MKIDAWIACAARRVTGGAGRRLPLIALLLAGGLAGCGKAPFELTLSALEGQRARWVESGVVDYRYDYRERCVCDQASTLEATIEVRGGQVTAVSNASGTGWTGSITAYPTIEDLFDRIETAIQDEAAVLSVSYDPELGYPTEIMIDYEYGAEQDGVAIDATGLVVL